MVKSLFCIILIPSLELLGVTFDYMLNFDKHISNICKKLQGK